jgi:anti-sigma regulatory factor (Ser/Thr protein kinase)
MTSLAGAGTQSLFSRTLARGDIERRETLTETMAAIAIGRRGDLATILAEVFANALRHGRITRLVVRAKRRGPILLLAFDHDPAISAAAQRAIARAKSGWLPDSEEAGPGGLGLPLLCRLSHRLTLSLDRVSLRIWLAAPSTGVLQ